MNAPALAVAVPLLGAALIAGLRPWLRRSMADVLAILTAGAVTALCLWLVVRSEHGLVVYWFGGHLPRGGRAVGISFAVDPFGAGLAALAAGLATLALVFSAAYFESARLLYHVLVLLFLSGMVGLALSGDLFNMFVFFEVMSVAAFALTGHKTEEKGPLQGAFNFAITNTVGAYLMLLGIALVYGRTGALNLAEIGERLSERPPDALVTAAFTLVATGFLVKGALVPFHFWLADAHAVAPSPVCTLFSGAMVELGLFGVARVYWTAFSGALGPHHAAAVRGVFVALGVVTALVGAAMCFRQRHFKRLLAFSTISHMGLFTIGFALLSGKALAGAALYVLAHGFSKAALFFVAGVLLNRTGAIDEEALRGKGKSPLLLAVTLVSALALAETPLFLTATGAELIAGSQGGWLKVLIQAVSFVASTLVGAAVFRAGAKIYLGVGKRIEHDVEQGDAGSHEQPESEHRIRRIPGVLLAPPILCVAIAIGVAFAPGLEAEASSAAARFMDRAGYAAAVLHGEAMAVPVPVHQEPSAAEKLPSYLSTVAALGVAAVALRGKLPARRTVAFLRWLERMQTGHAGDYVAWIAVGCALIGAVFWSAVR